MQPQQQSGGCIPRRQHGIAPLSLCKSCSSRPL